MRVCREFEYSQLQKEPQNMAEDSATMPILTDTQLCRVARCRWNVIKRDHPPYCVSKAASCLGQTCQMEEVLTRVPYPKALKNNSGPRGRLFRAEKNSFGSQGRLIWRGAF